MILKGKHVVVTGGGRGIGRTIAIRCATEGASVTLFARTPSELQETQDQISKLNGVSQSIVCDVSSAQDVNRSVKAAKEKLGPIDILVNNAGIQPPIGSFAKTDLDHWKKNIEVNLFGVINMTSAVLHDMMAKRRGKIVNLSGGGSTSPRPNFSAYAVAKTAIVRFTETVAAELKEYNIDVNAISPGAINTRMLDEVLKAGAQAGSEAGEAEKRKEIGGDDPELAAELICFLASDESDGITGKLISARWDPWKEDWFRAKLKSDKDFATLRRIDGKYFEKK